MKIDRLPIETKIMHADSMLFIVSQVQIPEKEGDNWLKAKTVFDPRRPVRRKPGEKPPVDEIAHLAGVYANIVEEQAESINAARDAFEESLP